MKLVWATVASLLLFPLASAYGEDPKSTADRLADLERMMQTLTEENRALRAELNGLKPAPAAPAKKEISIKASFHDGVKLAAEDGSFDAHIGGRLITQSRFFLESSRANDTFFVREARIQVDGSFWKDYEYKVQFDLGKGNAQLRDGYVGWKRYPWLTLRAGQYKEPIGLEQNTSARFIDFIERSPMDLLIPGYDIGARLGGSLLNGRVDYALGWFNGNGRHTSGDANDDKDLVARLTLRPCAPDDNPWLKGIRLGAAVTHGGEKQSFGNLALLDSGTTFLTMNSGVVNRGKRTRWNLEGAYTYGPFKLQGEATWMAAELNRTTSQIEIDDVIDFGAYYVEALWAVTGEDAGYDRRKVAKILGGDAAGCGRVEVGARFGQFWVEDAIFARGFASASASTQGVDNYTVGANWWLNPFTRVSLNYFHNEFWDAFPVGGKNEVAENGILTRLQIDF